jgi:hypothetical protein
MRDITITIPDDAAAHPCFSMVTLSHPPAVFLRIWL